MARGEIHALGLSAGSFATQVRADCAGVARKQRAALFALRPRATCAGLGGRFLTRAPGPQASSVSKARRAVLAGGVLLALGAVAAVAMISGEAVKTGHVRMELSDRNEFESQPAWYWPSVCAGVRVCACAYLRTLSLCCCCFRRHLRCRFR